MSGNDWQTPDSILYRVRRVDDITFDPCTITSNPCGATKFTTPECDPDGLLTDWWEVADGGLVFANIPYGRGLATAWAGKIVHEALQGTEIIALTRGDLSTRWAHMMTASAQRICFPPRIRFKGATGSPNFSNAVFYFGPRPQTFRRAFETLGPIVVPIPPTHRKEQ